MPAGTKTIGPWPITFAVVRRKHSARLPAERKFGRNPEGGVTRLGFSQADLVHRRR